MIGAPLCAFLALILFNGDFDLTQYRLAAHTYRCSQLRDGGRGIEVRHIHKINVFKILVRLQPATGHENISNTDGGSIFELHSDVDCIVLPQETSVNDVDDILLVVGPVFLRKLAGDFLKLFREIFPIRDTVPLYQCRRHNFPVFIPIGPKSGPGVFLASGVGHIEHVPQDRPVSAGVNEGNPLGATPHIPAHLVVPKIVFCAGGGVGPLGIDHKLVREGIFIDLTRRF
ncbi:MAG: hypothetical protein K2N78_08465 [Oscillospiraceae bacterium]|nr:hypothetical protein [Oscillospiraceae bacterium]